MNSSLELIDKKEQLKIQAENIISNAEKESRKLTDQENTMFAEITKQLADVDKDIRNLEKEVCELTVYLNKDFEIIENNNNNKKLSYIDIGQPFKFPWYLIRDSETYLNGMKPKEIFRYFKSICFNEEEYNDT